VAAAQDIPVVILCGGMGTRLREETERLPKPLLEIGNKPILWHIMKIYAHHGFRRFVLCLGYKGWLIKEFFLRYREQISDFTLALGGDGSPAFHDGEPVDDWEVTCAETGLTTGTGARLQRVRRYIDTDTFMLTYGDGVGPVDLRGLLDFHRAQGCIGTVTGVHPRSRYGEIKVEGDRAVEFVEKPSGARGLVSGGFFVFERAFLDHLDDDPALALEDAPLTTLASSGELAVFPHDEFWRGMDTHRDFIELNELWAGGNAPWRVWPD
jgi:glucose-1-phosphate cytidylyltransferase